MHIVICGAGQVGSNIARHLALEGNKVVVIDRDEALIQKINDTIDVQAITGFASHPHVLERAGLREADMMIAVTHSDEVNMIACQVAHSLFNVPTKIARVRHNDYLSARWQSLYSRDNLPIDFIISPEKEVADAILRRLHVPGVIDMIPFAKGKLHVIAVKLEQNCPLMNLPLSVVKARIDHLNIGVIGVIRQNQFSLPKPKTILQENDVIYIAAAPQDVPQTIKLFGHEEKEARRVIILGGGNVGEYIAESIEKDEAHDMRVKVIELSRSRAEKLAQRLQHTTIINGSGLEKEVLEECGISNAETMIAVSNDDKVNILASLLAKRFGCQRTISLVNNNAYIPMLGKLGLDVIINPRESTTSSILQHVRRGKIQSVHAIHDGAAEIVEAEALSTSKLVGKTIQTLNLPDGILIGAILRGAEIIIPERDTTILEKDQVLMVSTANNIKHVEKYFSVSLEFF